LHVEQSAIVSPERVADVTDGGAVRQDRLPVGAHAGQQLPVELRPRECAAGLRDDAPVSLADIAYVERLAYRGFQAVDVGQPRLRKLAHRATGAGSFGCGASGVTVMRIQSWSGRA
jgi:hypothetical protein